MTDIEIANGNITKLNTEVKQNCVTKEESKNFVTGEYMQAFEEYTTTTITKQNGILDIISGAMDVTT
jgi:hypothetical protein